MPKGTRRPRQRSARKPGSPIGETVSRQTKARLPAMSGDLVMINLIARAFRPASDYQSNPDGCEMLCVALVSTASDPAKRLAWKLVLFRRGLAADTDGATEGWKEDLSPLFLKASGDSLLARSWERIDLFASNQINDSTADLLDATPRLSFDTVSDSKPSRDTEWIWDESKSGEAVDSDRAKDSTAVSLKHDRSCLYLHEVSGKLFLIGNVRLRNLLRHASSRETHTSTWQFVLRLGTQLQPDESAIWRDGDLLLRDIFSCTSRDGGNVASSFARDVRKRAKQSFLVGDVAEDENGLPTQNKAARFRVGSSRKSGPPWLSAAARGFLESFLEKPFGFELGARNQEGGLALISSSSNKNKKPSGLVRFRFYAVLKWQNDPAKQDFTVPDRINFLIQEQSIDSNRTGRTYSPRSSDRTRFVEWRVLIVRPSPSGSGDSIKRVLEEEWNKTVSSPLLTALRTAKSGSPLSFVPSLRYTGGHRDFTWLAAIRVRDHSSNAAALDLAAVRASPPLVQPGQFAVRPIFEAVLDGAAPEAGRALRTQVVVCHPEEVFSKKRLSDPKTWMISEALFASDTAALAFGLQIIPPAPNAGSKKAGKASDRQWLKLGAIDLAIGSATENLGWRVETLTRVEPPLAEGIHLEFTAPVVTMEAQLPVLAKAGAVDRLSREDLADVDRRLVDTDAFLGAEIDRRFELEPPVVIELGPPPTESDDEADTAKSADGSDTAKSPADEPAGEPLVLRVNEAVFSGRSHNLQLKLFSQADASAALVQPRRVMVIDRMPFGIYLAESPPLSALASAESGEVAIWDAAGEGGAHWRLSEPKGGVNVILPPQGVAEAMEKAQGGRHPRDPENGKPVDFRFTPHARLVIDPSYHDQRYGETPWNVRRLFGFAEQREPGSRLTGFDVELLYGLAGQARGLENVLIAEVEARLGRPAGRQSPTLPWKEDTWDNESQKALWNAYRERWSRIRSMLHSRLGVLETYRLGGGELVIEQGLSWYQRGWKPESAQPNPTKTAKLAFPLPDYEQAKQTAPGVANELFDEDGLAGGWAWGFSSLNILEAVLRNPRSTSGFLTGLKFSALGGWGFQKASFDEDRSSIYGDTRMGRTSFYSLERIGRIGVFWNRAKHVIVFERSVAPSAQFVDQQDPQLGRPMLRKMMEYVELLEPDRAFPDSDAPKASRGCVLGLSFKTKKILVDSAWGQDVGRVGWKIPLWNPQAGRTKPSVYPAPKINFVMAADPEADVDSILALCSTPELLHFYTDTRPGTGAETDKWEPIRAVDFGVASARWVDGTDPLPSSWGESMDQQLPAEVAVPPGLHDFSFGIEPPERAVNLAADRVDAPLNAVLHNITLMRSAETSDSAVAGAPLVTDSSRFYQEARSIEHALKAVAAQSLSVEELKRRATTVIKQRIHDATAGAKQTSFVDRAAKIKGHYDGLTRPDFCVDVKARATDAFSRWAKTVGTTTAGAADDLVRRISRMEGGLATRLEEGSADIEKGIKDAQSRVAAARTEFSLTIADLEKQLCTGLSAASQGVTGLQRTALNGLDTFEAEIETAKHAITSQLDALKSLAAQIQGGIAEGNTTLDDVFNRVTELRETARGTFRRAAETLEKVERTIGSQGTALKSDGKTVLQAVRNLRTEISAAANQTDKALVWILAQKHQGAIALGGIQNAVATIANALDKLPEKVSAGLAAIELPTGNEARGHVAAATSLMGSVLKVVSETINESSKELHARLNTLHSALSDVLVPKDEQQQKLQAIIRALRLGQYGSQPIRIKLDGGLASIEDKLREIGDGTVGKIEAACNSLHGPLNEWLTKTEKAAADLAKKLIESLTGSRLDDLRAELESAADRIVGEATSVYEEAREALESSVLGPVLQEPDRAIRLLRAFGDPPRLPQLDFNRAAAAYLFGDPKDAIDLTPVTAWFDQVGDDLKALGIRLPTDKILDRLIPQDLKNFDFGKLLPDFAGLKLDRLFPKLRTPAALGDAVRLTHGLDKQRQRAWAEAKVNIQLGPKTELFAFGPLTLTLLKAKLDAFVKLETGLDGKVERRSKGEIAGNWQLDFGGQQLVTFRDTALRFDETGHTRFDLSPDRMDLAPALQYLSDLAKQLEYDENGFVFRILERNGLPYGAEALFSIALPPLQYGTSGLIGATIEAGMRLEAYPDFAIALHLNVSRRDSPFIFSVFILGGAGFVECSARYLPFRNSLTADVSIGLSASASLAFAFGPVSGQVAVMLGVSVEFHRQPGQRGGGLNMALTLLILGRVDVAGIITVHLSLLLEARYHDTGRITATGTLRISVRISRFFKLTVSTRVTYDFKSGKTKSKSDRQIESHPALQGAKALADAAA